MINERVDELFGHFAWIAAFGGGYLAITVTLMIVGIALKRFRAGLLLCGGLLAMWPLGEIVYLAVLDFELGRKWCRSAIYERVRSPKGIVIDLEKGCWNCTTYAARYGFAELVVSANWSRKEMSRYRIAEPGIYRLRHETRGDPRCVFNARGAMCWVVEPAQNVTAEVKFSKREGREFREGHDISFIEANYESADGRKLYGQYSWIRWHDPPETPWFYFFWDRRFWAHYNQDYRDICWNASSFRPDPEAVFVAQ